MCWSLTSRSQIPVLYRSSNPWPRPQGQAIFDQPLDVNQHNPYPTYLRGLIDSIGLSQRQIARDLGVDETL